MAAVLPAGADGRVGGRREQGKGPGGQAPCGPLFYGRAEGRRLCPAAGPLSPQNLLARARAAGLAGEGGKKGPGCGTLPRACRAETRRRRCQRARAAGMAGEGNKARDPGAKRPAGPFLWKGRSASPLSGRWNPFSVKPVGKGAGGRVGVRGREKGGSAAEPFPAPIAPRHGGSVASGRGRPGWCAKGTRQGTRGPSALRVLFYGRAEVRRLCPAAGPLSRAGRAGGLGRRAGRPSAPAFFYPQAAAKNAKLLPQISRLPWWKGENGRNIGDCVCISPVAMLH